MVPSTSLHVTSPPPRVAPHDSRQAEMVSLMARFTGAVPEHTPTKLIQDQVAFRHHNRAAGSPGLENCCGNKTSSIEPNPTDSPGLLQTFTRLLKR